MPDESSGDSTAGPWHLQVHWPESVTETFTTFKAAHERAIELVSGHEGAGGTLYGVAERVGVNASYYNRSESELS